MSTTTQFIDEIIEVLSSQPRLQEYFRYTIETLNDRKERWKQDSVFIGMVGVTSSGKSTLMNALFGESLLPSRVKPSSGCLVWCSEGEERTGTIKFRDNSELVLQGEDLTYDKISEYADESHNPGNRKNVAEIKLQSPRFLFREGIMLVDSPGLDAEALDNHELITLTNLIPLMDICYIIVPSKPNSDARFVDYIRVAVNAKKPVIIIQNMIDSVEEEYGENGVVVKTREQVMNRHRTRIRRNLRTAGINPNKVSILQVSALWALEGRVTGTRQPFIDSNLQALIDTTKEFIEERRPIMDAARIRSLQLFLDEKVFGVEDIGQQLTGNEISSNTPKFNADNLRNIIDNFNNRLAEVESIKGASKEILEDKVNRIRNLGDEDFDRARGIIGELKQHLINYENDRLKTIEAADANLRDIIRILNLTEEEFKIGYVTNSNIPSAVGDITRTETESRLIEVDGGWAGFKRWITPRSWEWGREWREYTVAKLNKDAAVSELRSKYENHSNRFISALNVWLEIRLNKKQTIENEYDRLRKQAEVRKRLEIEKEEINRIFSKVKIINQKMSEAGKTAEPESILAVESDSTHEASPKMSPMEVRNSTLWLHRLSNDLINANAKALAYSEPVLKEAEFICVAGWNEDAIAAFVRRSFGINIYSEELEEGSPGVLEIHTKPQGVIIMNCRVASEEKQKEVAATLRREKIPLYLLVNTHQIGSSRKQLNNSVFIGETADAGTRLIPVIEDIRESRFSNSIGESIEVAFETGRALSESGFEIVTALVNHQNPVFSKLLISKFKNRNIAPEELIKLQEKIISANNVFLRDQKLKQFVNEFAVALRNLK